jgi:hypothetical protein
MREAQLSKESHMPPRKKIPTDDSPPRPANGGALPAATARYRPGGSTAAFTAEEVRGCLVNPLSAGIGPFPQLVPDEQWVRAASRMIREDGSEQFLVNLLFVLRQALGGLGAEP